MTILTISHGDAARILEVYIAVLNKELAPQFTFREGQLMVEVRMLLDLDLVVSLDWAVD